MSEITTEAGKALLTSEPFLRWEIDGVVTPVAIRDRIIAIEQEARTQVVNEGVRKGFIKHCEALTSAAQAVYDEWCNEHAVVTTIEALAGALAKDGDSPIPADTKDAEIARLLRNVVEKWDAMYGRVKFVGTQRDSIEGGLEFDAAMSAARQALAESPIPDSRADSLDTRPQQPVQPFGRELQ